MFEAWVPLKGYDGLYMISNLGKIYHLKRKRLLSMSLRGGYNRVWLFDADKVKKQNSVHRLVGENFILNPLNKPEINHIKGIKKDNRVSEIEWCTRSENAKHASDLGLYPKICTKPRHLIDRDTRKMMKKVINTETGEIYESTKMASEKYGIKRSTLIHYLIGTRNNLTPLKYL